VDSIGSETAGVAETSFSELDVDSDGYLSKEEASERTVVTKQWDRIDKNQDDQIDQAEFAAFETGHAKEPPVPEGKSSETVPGKSPRQNKEPYGQGGM
jgi:hypothetical protein